MKFNLSNTAHTGAHLGASQYRAHGSSEPSLCCTRGFHTRDHGDSNSDLTAFVESFREDVLRLECRQVA